MPRNSYITLCLEKAEPCYIFKLFTNEALVLAYQNLLRLSQIQMCQRYFKRATGDPVF